MEIRSLGKSVASILANENRSFISILFFAYTK
jgi:hypothetical protein